MKIAAFILLVIVCVSTKSVHKRQSSGGTSGGTSGIDWATVANIALEVGKAVLKAFLKNHFGDGTTADVEQNVSEYGNGLSDLETLGGLYAIGMLVTAAFLLLLVVALISTNANTIQKRQWATIGAIALEVGKAVLKAFLKNHYGDGTTADLTVSGRSMQLKILSKDPGHVKLCDRSSKLCAEGNGDTLEVAIEAAGASLVKTLLEKGHMSIHDLHLKPTPPSLRTTKFQCVDTHGSYCIEYAALGYCTDGHHFSDFMMNNCRRTCGKC